jgi:hypothetical protein
MKRTITMLMTFAVLTATLAGPALANANGTTERGITPTAYDGNFVSSDDDQVCYDMAALGYIGAYDGEMRGFKIDPPVAYSDGNISTTINPGGRVLNWTSTAGTEVLAFVIKGGPKYNVYDYVNGAGTPPFNWDVAEYDNGLISPAQKGKTPQISHYNVCYYPPPTGEFTGCTPGYWRNHADRWLGVAPADDFDTTFGIDLFAPDITLAMAINSPQTYGTFAFHAVAALLNSYGGVPNADGTVVEYEYTTAEVIQMVQDAVADGTQEATKDLFAAANEAGCPLSGTKAVLVP